MSRINSGLLKNGPRSHKIHPHEHSRIAFPECESEAFDATPRKLKEAVSEPFAVIWPLIQAVSIVRCLSWEAVVTRANDERKNVAETSREGTVNTFKLGSASGPQKISAETEVPSFSSACAKPCVYFASQVTWCCYCQSHIQ
jgi:hypothetical protein